MRNTGDQEELLCFPEVLMPELHWWRCKDRGPRLGWVGKVERQEKL